MHGSSTKATDHGSRTKATNHGSNTKASSHGSNSHSTVNANGSIIQLLLDTHQVAVVAEVCKRTLHTARMTSGTALQKAAKVTEWCKLGLL